LYWDGYRYIATSHRNDDNSGEYVTIADYYTQEQTIKAQQAEIAKLRGLLQQWETISPKLGVESRKFPIWIKSEQLKELINDTSEALK